MFSDQNLIFFRFCSIDAHEMKNSSSHEMDCLLEREGECAYIHCSCTKWRDGCLGSDAWETGGGVLEGEKGVVGGQRRR
jgi:hypothetical protein